MVIAQIADQHSKVMRPFIPDIFMLALLLFSSCIRLNGRPPANRAPRVSDRLKDRFD